MTEKPLTTARDDRGVTHRLWRWTEPVVIKALTDAVKRGDVLIADGHHRLRDGVELRARAPVQVETGCFEIRDDVFCARSKTPGW